MCGILVYHNPDGLDRGEVDECIRSLALINHRGPDGEGVLLFNTTTRNYAYWNTHDTPEDKRTGAQPDPTQFDLLLGHRRLSIQDVTSAGHQPMIAHNAIILFNGEVYNFPEIRMDLERKGYQFESTGDTEVILAAYKEWGEDCFARFNGMWAMCLTDLSSGKVVLSRDRFGVKPLYTSTNGKMTICASEIKQFTAFPSFSAVPDMRGVRSFLDHGMLEEDSNTLLKDVAIFPAASVAKLNDGRLQSPRKFYQIPESKNTWSSFDDACDAFRVLFADAVKVRLRTDVPWGIGLSGGMDSSAVVYAAHRLLDGEQKRFDVLSAVFPGHEMNEEEHIDTIVKDLNLDAHKTVPSSEFGHTAMRRHIHAQDTPTVSTSFFAQHMVAKLAHSRGVKVLLVGQGGDELFAGYHHHFYRYLRNLLVKGRLRRYRNELKAYALLKHREQTQLKKIARGEVILALKTAAGIRKTGNKWEDERYRLGTLRRFLNLDLQRYTLPFFLHSDDRTGMAYSIESRHPFMDYRLIDFAQSLPDDFMIKDGWQKRIIRESFPEMPESIRYRKDKKGFATPQKSMIEQLGAEFLRFSSLAQKEYGAAPNAFRSYTLGIWHDLFINGNTD